MRHGITPVCIQTGYMVIMRIIKREVIDHGIVKIKESIVFLASELKIVNDLFTMIRR